MKWSFNKFIKIIIPLTLCLLITGSGFLDITFSGTDSSNPLVDLGVLIKTGGNHMSVESPGEAAENHDAQTGNNTDQNADATSQEGSGGSDLTSETGSDIDAISQAGVSGSDTDSRANSVANVVIYGTGITFNGLEQTEERLMSLLDSAAKTGMAVEIDNTYADYRLFKRVADHINDQNLKGISIITR